ncbi:unnamed protein product [Didymodactylos carnosus]|uniref:Mannosyltransferase n=1 Tax=Didymodactylos carnosus TaxID=1234261 RepID=A0A8S2WD25_9BILA|nr:unnamed protein product [Didymodactylos carnosus]CAF4439678.1 unnamed protein product [Didymodactylos carnosus]
MKTYDWLSKLLKLIIYGHLILNIIQTSIALYASHYNYPGAQSLLSLQKLYHHKSNVTVHIDVYAAENGISRFLELKRADNWRYNKTEMLTIKELTQFDFLLVESNNEEDNRLKPYLTQGFHIINFIRGFNGFYIDKNILLKMRWIPKIYILSIK